MKSTTNAFLGGLKTDYHPLTQDQRGLTDALNATLITYNGNEMMLQNDMGNTKIQDSTTGNIMGLRDGFVPLGMKEHGGILYIASYNLNTKQGELGTIPSPVFNYTYNSAPDLNKYSNPVMSGLLPTATRSLIKYNGNTLTDPVEKYNLYTENAFQINDTRLRVGDKFLLSLDIDQINDRTVRKAWVTSSIPDSSQVVEIQFPQISQVQKHYDGQKYSGYGWFRLELLAKCAKSEHVVNLSNITDAAGRYWPDNSTLTGTINESEYWFLHDDITSIDVDRNIADFCYETYPNIEPGYLYIKLEPEMPHSFSLTDNKALVCVVFDSILPDIPTLNPPEEGYDPVPPFTGDENEVPDDPFLPDPEPNPDPEQPGETQDDVNPYLLPYDGTKFDTDGLNKRASGTRLRSPFRRYWNGQVVRDDDGNIIYEDSNESTTFADQTILYLSASTLSAFTSTFTNGDSELSFTNYFLRSNQLNTLSFDLYKSGGLMEKWRNDELLQSSFREGNNIPEGYTLTNVQFDDLFYCTNDIPNFNSLYTWHPLGTKISDDGTESRDLVNTLYIYHDPANENSAGTLTQIVGDQQASDLNTSTGQFGLASLDTKLLFNMCRDLYKADQQTVDLITQTEGVYDQFGCIPSRKVGQQFSIPYQHEKAIVAIPINEGDIPSDEGDSSSNTEYILALAIFPHVQFPKLQSKIEDGKILTYSPDDCLNIDLQDLPNVLDKLPTWVEPSTTSDWFLDYNEENTSRKKMQRAGGGQYENPDPGDFSIVENLQFYASDQMKTLVDQEFKVTSEDQTSSYNFENGKYIYNDGQPVNKGADWTLGQACAILPFVTRRTYLDIFGGLNEEISTSATYVGYPELRVNEDGLTYYLAAPYIKLELNNEEGNLVLNDLTEQNVLQHTGILVHLVDEQRENETYYHRDIVVHAEENGKFSPSDQFKLSQGYLTLVPVDDNWDAQLSLKNKEIPNAALGQDADLVTSYLNEHNCIFANIALDDDGNEYIAEEVAVRLLYCRAHEELVIPK